MLSFCRGYKGSSFLIRLLFTIIKDISSFFIIFVFMILIFTFSTFTIQNVNFNVSLFKTGRFFHRLVIGDVDEKLKDLTWNSNNYVSNL
jgi:hypothetical protein